MLEVLMVRIFPHSVRMRKILTRKTPNTETFYALNDAAHLTLKLTRNAKNLKLNTKVQDHF